MPKILSYTPAWLTRPSPGYSLFCRKNKSLNEGRNGQRTSRRELKARKIIAHRGTEIFVVVDNEIRWSDLVMIRERGEEAKFNAEDTNNDIQNSQEGVTDGTYRVLKVPVSGEIRQLSISPAGDYMAIATSHTVHVTILPSSSLLTGDSSGSSPIRSKTFQLGPTAHVLERTSLASILWHPLGPRGHSLVTITEDAVLRLWDVNKDDRWSFAEPALALDLQKLATSSSVVAPVDVAPLPYGASKAFSPDNVGIDVAAACFGGESKCSISAEGEEYEDPWAPMTLYIALSDGDIYALCPFLPARWQASSSLLQALRSSVAERLAEGQGLEDKERVPDSSVEEHLQYQKSWVANILKQEPLVEQSQLSIEPTQTYRRPTQPSIVPALQGPFRLSPEMDEETEITDMVVLEATNMPENDEGDWESIEREEESDGLSMAVMAFATNDGKVHIYLQVEGIEGRWLPQSSDSSKDNSNPGLIAIESIRVFQNEAAQPYHPVFTKDTKSNYAFFVTNETGLYHISIASWARALGRELNDASIAGAEFRIDLLLRGIRSDVQALLQTPQMQPTLKKSEPSACVVLDDSDLGHFVLLELNKQPFAVTLADIDGGLDKDPDLSPDPFGRPKSSDSAVDSSETWLADGNDITDITEFRPVYQPPEAFWARSALHSTVDTYLQNRHRNRKLLADEIRLSSATLEIMTEAHRTLSTETHQLGIAVSDLFRRCERLRDEFADQIRRVDELATKIDGVTGEDENEGEGEEGAEDSEGGQAAIGAARIEQRLERARSRQEALSTRHREIRKRLSKMGTPPLTEAEKTWAREVQELERSAVEGQTASEESNGTYPIANDAESRLSSSASHRPAEKTRFDEIKKVAAELIEQGAQVAKNASADEDKGSRERQEPVGAEDKGWLAGVGDSGRRSRRGSPAAIAVPSHVRRAKVNEVMEMLGRESALVEATAERLHRLTVQAL